MSSRTKLLLDDIDQLPAWAARMARKYYAGEASHFLLFNNIYDLVRSGSEYISLPNYLQRELVGTKHLITYNRSEGIKFGSPEAERAFQAQLRVADPLMGRDALKQLPRDPGRAIPLIEYFLLYGEQVAVIINFLDTIIPPATSATCPGTTAQIWLPFSAGSPAHGCSRKTTLSC